MTMADTEILDELGNGAEATVRDRIKELETEIARLKTQLAEAREAKKILLVTGDELRTEVMRFFTEALSSPAQRAEGAGDFWLVAEAVGENWAFGEIRESADGNVTRANLAEVIIDRSNAGQGDDFPAILVVNTYASKTTMDERDQPIPEDVRRRAAEDNVLVVRTLDLVRLHQKETSGFPGIKEFLEAIRSGGGWFEVNDALSSKVHAS